MLTIISLASGGSQGQGFGLGDSGNEGKDIFLQEVLDWAGFFHGLIDTDPSSSGNRSAARRRRNVNGQIRLASRYRLSGTDL